MQLPRMMVVHALYYLATRLGWAEGRKLHWRLTERGIFSPELQRMIAMGRAPHLPAEVAASLKRLVEELCRGLDGACGAAVIAAARAAAAQELGLAPRESLPMPTRLTARIEKLLARQWGPGEETIITPTPGPSTY